MLETECYALIYDSAKNKVTGVKARGYDGTEYVINAKAVVLAGGGFGGSAAMENTYLSNEYFPLKGSWKLWGMSQNKGQMIQSAIDNGAATFNIGMVPCTHFNATADIVTDFPVYYRDGLEERMQEQNTWTLNDIPVTLGLSTSTMQVGKNGKRNFNEAGTFAFWKGGTYYFTIYGGDFIDGIATKGFTGNVGTFSRSTKVYGSGGCPNGVPLPQIYEVLDHAITKGYLYKADTLEKLAALMGVPAADFVAEVAKYQGFCKTGVDTDFKKPASGLVSNINRAPYYAIKCFPTPYSTIAALDINSDINVLKKDGTPMGGLYACGNDSGGVLYAPDDAYAQYGGVALGWAFTSGRLAGYSVSKYLASL